MLVTWSTDFGIDLLWHPSLGMELGDNAKKIFYDCVRRPAAGHLRFRRHRHSRAERLRPVQHVRRSANEGLGEGSGGAAGAVVAIGDCACWGGIPATEPNPVDNDRTAVPQARARRLPRRGLPLEMGLPVVNIPGCPAHPDWITQILVAIATGRAGDIALDELQRPQTFFKTFTQTGCTRVQFFEYKQSTHGVRPGHAHRLPVLRVRLPRADDALAVQPDPVEPPVIEDPRRACRVPAAPSPNSRSTT